MKSFKNILKSFLYGLVLFIILSLLYTIIGYFNLLSSNAFNIIKLIISLLVFTFGGFLAGKKADKNGWLEGIKISFLLSLVMMITTVILKEFKIEYFLYIFILTVSGILGSIIGINRKSNI